MPAESQAARREKGILAFRASLRLKSITGTPQERSTCAAILKDKNLFQAAFEDTFEKYSQQAKGPFSNIIEYIKAHWQEILKFLLTLLMLEPAPKK